MALMDVNLKPNDKILKDFGIISLVMSIIIASLLHWVKSDPIALSTAGYIVAAGFIVFIMSLISVSLVKPIYIVLVFVTIPIGWVISHLVLGLFYYGMITPVAIYFKLIGRDVMCRKYDKQCDSYWIEHEDPASVKRYKQQF